MMTAIHEWPKYIAEIYRVTGTGCRVQLTEMGMTFTSHSGTLRKDSGLKLMERALQKYSFINHFDLQVGPKLSVLLESAGFHSVEEKVIEVPIGAWPTGQRIWK